MISGRWSWRAGTLAGVVVWDQVREWLGRRAGASGYPPAALATESFPCCPPRAVGVGCGLPGVGLEAGEDGVADPTFESAEGFFVGLAVGEFLVVVSPALTVAVVDLGDRRHVDDVVEAPVPAPGKVANGITTVHVAYARERPGTR